MSSPAQLAAVHAALTNAANAIKKLKAENVEHSAQLAEIVAAESKARDELRKAGVRNAALQTSQEALQAECLSFKAQCEEKNIRINDLAEDLKSARCAEASLQTELSQSKKDCTRIRTELHSVASVETELRSKISNLEKKRDALEQSVTELKSEVATAKAKATAQLPMRPGKRAAHHLTASAEPTVSAANGLDAVLDLLMESVGEGHESEAASVVDAADSVAAWVRARGPARINRRQQIALTRTCARVVVLPGTRAEPAITMLLAGLLYQLAKPRRLGAWFLALALGALAAEILQQRELPSPMPKKQRPAGGETRSCLETCNGAVSDAHCRLLTELCRRSGRIDAVRTFCCEVLMLPSQDPRVCLLGSVAEMWPAVLGDYGGAPLGITVEWVGTQRLLQQQRITNSEVSAAHVALTKLEKRCGWGGQKMERDALVALLLRALGEEAVGAEDCGAVKAKMDTISEDNDIEVTASEAAAFGATMGLRLVAAQSTARWVHDSLLLGKVWPLLVKSFRDCNGDRSDGRDDDLQCRLLRLVGALGASPVLRGKSTELSALASRFAAVLHHEFGASPALRRSAEAALREMGKSASQPIVLQAHRLDLATDRE